MAFDDLFDNEESFDDLFEDSNDPKELRKSDVPPPGPKASYPSPGSYPDPNDENDEWDTGEAPGGNIWRNDGGGEPWVN